MQLSELLVRLSQLQVKPHQQWLQDVLDTLQPRLQELSTAQLSSMLQVLGGWGFMPPEPFMQQLHAAVHKQTHKMSMRHIADMAWGLAQLQNPRQPLLTELLQAASDLMRGSHCSASSILAQQRAALQRQHQQDQGISCQQDQQQLTCCPASLADLVWSVAKLQHSPGKGWLDTFADISLPLLDSFTPHQLAQVIWAFARLPYQPAEPWMNRWVWAAAIESLWRKWAPAQLASSTTPRPGHAVVQQHSTAGCRAAACYDGTFGAHLTNGA